MVGRFGALALSAAIALVFVGCSGDGSPGQNDGGGPQGDAGDAGGDSAVHDVTSGDSPRDSTVDTAIDAAPPDSRPPDSMPDTMPDAPSVTVTYTAVMIQDKDTDMTLCSATNGPGADIDAVELRAPSGVLLGVGKKGTASYADGTSNSPPTPPCMNSMCAGGLCKYADKAFVSRTEGPRDGKVNAVGDDEGYFSLNNGRLAIQIGDETGNGTVKSIVSGMQVKVWEVDQVYVSDGRAPATCRCIPEKYDVYALRSAGSSVGAVKLKRMTLDAKNGTQDSCKAAMAPGDDTTGCGSTVFVVP